MIEYSEEKLKEHFQRWSGGFPPESDFEIYVYIDAANPFDVPDSVLWEVLQNWMNEPWELEPFFQDFLKK